MLVREVACFVEGTAEGFMGVFCSFLRPEGGRPSLCLLRRSLCSL
jgi:hypothetical protein